MMNEQYQPQGGSPATGQNPQYGQPGAGQYSQPGAGQYGQYGQPGCGWQQPGTQPPAPPRSGREKSGFLTFCFAFIPGAAQMYLGYFKRGLSLIGLFCLGWWISNVIGSLWFLMAIVWMFNFFDAFDLRGKLAAGVELEDNYVIPVKDAGVDQLLSKRHAILGWCLIAAGCFAIYDSILSPLVWRLCSALGIEWLSEAFGYIPSVALIAVLIGLGVWLVRGPKEKNGAPEEDVHYYGENTGEGSHDEQQ